MRFNNNMTRFDNITQKWNYFIGFSVTYVLRINRPLVAKLGLTAGFDCRY